MTDVKEYAKELASIFSQIDELKTAAADIVASAKDAGINVRALRKVAREFVTDSDKLAKLYEQEEQIDMFRAEVGMFSLKGLEATEKAGSAHRALGHKKVGESAAAFDAVAGSNIAGEHKRLTKAVTAKIVRDAEART